MAFPLTSRLALYRIWSEIARGWPETLVNQVPEPCLRLNSFGVFHTITDLDADNSMKSAKYENLDIAFNRDGIGAKTCYPLLGAIEDRFLLSYAGTPKQNDTETMTIFVADQMPGNCRNCPEDGYCKNRVWEQVGVDLRKLMKQFVKVFNRFIYTQVIFQDTSSLTGWYDKLYLDKLRTAGDVLSFDCRDEMRHYIGKNAQGEIFYDQMNDNLAMVFLRLPFRFAACEELGDVDVQYGSNAPIISIDEGCIAC